MLLKRKQESGQPSLDALSRPPRYASIARVSINGFEGEAALRNVSNSGFRMESRTYAAITVGEHYTMWIKPESASGLTPFELEVEVRWVQSTESKFASGFLILNHPADGSVDRYVNYIKRGKERGVTLS
jgi:hypothetical protein